MESIEQKPSPPANQLWDLAKIGIAFYVLGLFTVFIYFIQLQILSVDLLKPAAIIIGIYVWALLAVLPSGFLLLLEIRDLKPWLHNLLFLLVIASMATLLTGFFNGLRWLTILFSGLLTLSIYCYHSRNGIWAKVGFQQSYNRMGLFCVFVAILFSLSIYPRLPQYLGGGKPISVKVYPEDKQVMLSQFSLEEYDADSCISADLLYEGNDDYYFIDEIKEQQSGILVEYRIHKVQKKIIKKIIFRKSNWINFK